jgi:hypothetical protein
MTTEPHAPSAFAKAESGSRAVVLMIGMGVVAFILGSVMSAGAGARIAERLGPPETALGAWLFRWVFDRLWLFAVMPFFGYAAGRFTELKPGRFALFSVLSGETFSILLISAINGFEYLTDDPYDVLARVVTLFLGMLITARAVQAGKEVADRAQAEANVIAEKRKAEYAAAILAAGQEKRGESLIEMPNGLPLPEGERVGVIERLPVTGSPSAQSEVASGGPVVTVPLDSARGERELPVSSQGAQVTEPSAEKASDPTEPTPGAGPTT